MTGAARGIGAATALALAGDGWPVAVNYRSDADGAGAVVERIARRGGPRDRGAAPTSPTASRSTELFERAEAELGPVLVLVNNAGMRADGLAPQLDAEDWGSVLDTNLSAAFHTTRRALRPMLRARFGRIVNVASVVGIRANAGQANYAASKAGPDRDDEDGRGRGRPPRDHRERGRARPGRDQADRGDLGNGLADAIPARRAGTPEEVAACVRFLASEEAGLRDRDRADRRRRPQRLSRRPNDNERSNRCQPKSAARRSRR